MDLTRFLYQGKAIILAHLLLDTCRLLCEEAPLLFRGSVRPAIRTVSVWAIVVKGLSNRTTPTLQMKPMLVYFELERSEKGLLLILAKISTRVTGLLL
jgi:hypothetical protein